MSKIKWLDDVEEKDYDAALSYLTLRLSARSAERLVKALRKAELQHFRANDILRASRLEPAPRDDPGVEKALHKVYNGERLSPVLLIDHADGCDPADGYHRVSAAYWKDPDTMVPARLA